MTTLPHDAGNAGSVTVEYSPDGRVATITIDRAAKLNALTLAMLDELRTVCVSIGRSAAAVVVVRTAGDRVFSVGADINHFSQLDSVAMWRSWVATGHAAFDAVEALPQPSVSVVDGLAYGGGLELALSTDFRVFASNARVALPETGLGTIPGWGGTQRLPALVGEHRAKDMILTRRVLDAPEALDWGIATRLAADGALDAEVDGLITQLLGSAPIAMQLAKQSLRAVAGGTPASISEALASGVAFATRDSAEGLAAFRDKRPPNFQNL
ncbi:MAG: enoyl-CoA hydratase/isomerase family protein [Microcella sp.]|uniref:enoyl-CoA hydratase/isomerase family protein n=1 Tax=Microcella sp. TaxID=1913979 RepID=UPI00331564FC